VNHWPEDVDALDAGASLAERLAFERLLADLSTTFANVASDRVITEIESGLTRLVEFLGFERSTLGEFSPDGSQLVVLCSIAVPGVPATPRGPLPGQLTWFLGELRAGRSVMLPSLPDDIPPGAAGEMEYARRTGLRSLLTIPLRLGGQIIGAISFSAFRSTRAWPDDLITRLRLLGEVFGQALVRSRADTAIREAHDEIKRLNTRLEAENSYLRQAARGKLPGELASHSPRFKAILEDIQQVAPTQSTVLLLGETGCGKEVLARAIHELSGRKQRPMVKVNCAALPATLIEAELFGREKGAYTGALARQMGRFELADGATIFLDEIGELPLELQPKLLRVLQNGEFERLGGTQTIKVDVRVIAASNRDLGRAAAEGTFRQDLYYRLNVFPIDVPPLRERPEDIPMLAWAFIHEFRQSMAKPITAIADESMAALQAYAWPGNVRELRNLIERAMILARDPTLQVSLGRQAPQPGVAAPGSRDDAERAHILSVLDRCAWRIRGSRGAAAALDMKPTTLESRMKRLGITRASSDARS
jgi:formate hydrogenlyase transcriptional activator